MRIKGISLALSLLFHVIFIYSILKFVPPIRFYLFHKVADVFIASSDSISFPPIGKYVAGTGTREELPQKESSVAAPISEGEDSIPGERDRGEVFLANLSLGRDRGKIEESSSPYGALPDFDLDASPRQKTDFSLSLSVPQKIPKSDADEKTSRNMDLFRLVSPGLSSLRFNRIESIGNTRRNRASGTAQDISSLAVDFDISPWAKEALDKIRNSWIVPPIEESRARGKAKIQVVIGKDGKLIGLEVVESSDFLPFDESAVDAIRSSAPFLPLPDDFPAERLEIYLVFEFNE
jgi:TonB family protein